MLNPHPDLLMDKLEVLSIQQNLSVLLETSGTSVTVLTIFLASETRLKIWSCDKHVLILTSASLVTPLHIPPRSLPPWVAFQILTSQFRARPQSPPLCWWLSHSGSCPNPSKPHTRPPGTAPVSQSPQTVFQLVSPKPACSSSLVPAWRNHNEDCQPELPPLSLVTGPGASSWTPSWHGGTPFSWELPF